MRCIPVALFLLLLGGCTANKTSHPPVWHVIIRDADYKFIQAPFQESEGLYDVVADPAERNDLLKTGDVDADRVADALRPRLESWADSASPLKADKTDSAEMRKKLRALGYVD